MALDPWICQAISSALRMPNSVLTELHLVNNNFYDRGTRSLIDGLSKSQCKLKALRLVKQMPSSLCNTFWLSFVDSEIHKLIYLTQKIN